MSIEDETRHVRTTSLGWMIQRIASRLEKDMNERLSVHGLNIQQFAIMMTVLENKGLTQTEIGEYFTMPAYTISRAIDHLENRGFVERKAHPTSRRSHRIHPTKNGRDLSETLFGIVGDVNGALAKSLATKEREALGTLLAKLV